MAKPRRRRAKPAAPAKRARSASVVDAFAGRRGVVVEPGWGRGNVVLKVNAKIFAIVSADRCVAKLSASRVDELVAAGAGTRFDPRKNGRVMKQWLVVTDRARWLALAREAYALGVRAST